MTQLPRPRGTILIICDDADARLLIAVVAQSLGFSPTLAANGPLGLAMLAAGGASLRAVVIDLHDDPRGGAFARQVENFRPGTPVILLGDEPPPGLALPFGPPTARRVLPHPLTAPALAATLAELLGG